MNVVFLVCIEVLLLVRSFNVDLIRFLALRIRWRRIEAWNMVPIITREGIEAFRAMPVTVATKKNARLRSAPAQRRQAWHRSHLGCVAFRSGVVCEPDSNASRSMSRVL